MSGYNLVVQEADDERQDRKVGISNRQRLILALSVLMPALVINPASAIDRQQARAFVGEDVHLQGQRLLSYQPAVGEHVLVFEGGFSMSIGANGFSSDNGVVWLKQSDWLIGSSHFEIQRAAVYLEQNISVQKGGGAETVDLTLLPAVSDGGEQSAMVVWFDVTGEVFVTAESRQTGSPHELPLYERAVRSFREAKDMPRFVVQPGAVVPAVPEPDEVSLEVAELPAEPVRPTELVEEPVAEKPEPVEAGKSEFMKKAISEAEVVQAAREGEEKEARLRYPVNFAPAGEAAPKIEKTVTADGTNVATVIGRFYIWQRQDEKGGLLELIADNAVVFYRGSETAEGAGDGGEDTLTAAGVTAVYMSGDVVMTEGHRTVRADEIYYDFERKKALAVNAVMRNFDVSRGIPVYVRAAKLRQLAENKFAADNITLTNSEFYLPQISLNASNVIITDTTIVDEQSGKLSDSSFDVQMSDVRLKVEDTTIFYWPFMRSNLQRPDIPIKSVHLGYDDTWGVSAETRWHLARLLGLREAEGTESTFALDYYDKRGFGSGFEIDYERENYFGRMLGYLISDSGKDKLGRLSTRRDLVPDEKLRGRFLFRHRHFLPYNWQVSTEVSYASDERFIEGYYRNEFDVGKQQETLIHAKRLEDNWALSLLAKARINNFADKLEEMPSGQFHLTGQSLFEDKLTLYSDTQLGRLRQRTSSKRTPSVSDEWFFFAAHRSELDMPVTMGDLKVIPFVAGTFGYDDRSGFTKTLVDGSNTGSFGEDKVWIGEAGVRIASQGFWKVYPDIKSRLWNLDQLRHIIKPQALAVMYGESDAVVEQRDTLSVGVSQRLQTRRAVGGSDSSNGTKTVDWMRLDTHFTWVDDPVGPFVGADRIVWNRPFLPLQMISTPRIFNTDLTQSELRRSEAYGARRNYFAADYLWNLSDTFAILADMNFDMQSAVVQQLSFGLSHTRWPDFSLYIGGRYLRRVEVLDEKGSNVLTFAASYKLDPRYTLIFSHQYDFDYGANLETDITLVRRYHRMYCGFTFSVDDSLDEQRIIFSVWPQGLPELAIGSRRHVCLSALQDY